MISAVIYGAGSGGKKALKVFSSIYNIMCFIDKDKNKDGTYIDNIPVKVLKGNEQLLRNNIVIIGSSFQDAETFVSSIEGAKYIPFSVTRELNNKICLRKYPCNNLLKEHLEECKVLTNRSEMLSLLSKDGIVAEVGVFKGDFSKEILKVVKPKKLYLIDIWEDSKIYNEVLKRFKREIEEGIVEIIKGDSRQELSKFKDKYFDWVYLDTNHDYETPRSELEVCQHKVKNGGVIAGHDYIKFDYTYNERYGVVEAVNEFCVRKNWKFIYLTLECNGFNSYALKKI
ncbi:3-oxoacyl-ACP reductase [Clostridium sporogenes]|uniref:class I SAM-dependent methyltransferase n=1 Tax=Clostridium sporogenes TaxID=1509 RepID=UPI0013D56649|nr:class I SAM-dependent methyltransferase [Clostridium sporogenes]EJE7233271.1 class I SAM-dependent methyltransferase [Clostridium botulinum]NFE81710.1 3-oxoacyl-ACP reductase [Clostridium sporogenes]NFG67691.1 3-oxoacyl-ACP reductase [Clostridium sporogenes]